MKLLLIILLIAVCLALVALFFSCVFRYYKKYSHKDANGEENDDDNGTWINTQEKANEHLKQKGYHPIAKNTRFYHVYKNGSWVYRWLAKDSVTFEFIIFDAKGKNLQIFTGQPKFIDICPLHQIILFGKKYLVKNDIEIIADNAS